MGKIYNNLWSGLVSFENLYLAYRKASRGKRSKAAVSEFGYNLEANLLLLQDELVAGRYQPGSYHSFLIHDPKKRLISAAPFRDRVVHHALINIIEPIYECKFIHDTYANRVGKGTHRALDRCTKYLRKYQYVLQMDIRQYFPSIDHQILLNIIQKTIKDEQVLVLCRSILRSGEGVQNNIYQPVYFPGDSLFAGLRPRGLPIGNLTSQFWANVYLNDPDHFVKRILKCKGYIRYVDDMLLFSDSKPELHDFRDAVIEHLAAMRLRLHESKAQVRPTQTGVAFLGFVVYPDYRRLKRVKAVQARRRIKGRHQQYLDEQITRGDLDASVLGWVNHARYGDTWGLRKSMLQDIRL